MSFLNLFRKKTVEPEKVVEDVSVDFNNLVSFYNEKLSEDIKNSSETAKDLQKRIVSLFGSIPIKDLERSSFESSDKKYAAVNMTKNTYVSKINGLITSVPSPGSSYLEILSFYQKSNDIIKEMKDTTPKQMMSLSNFFKKQIQPVIEHIKKIDLALSELKKLLDNSKMKVIHDLDNYSKSILELLEKANQVDSKKSSVDKEISSLVLEKESKQNDLENVLNSDQWEKIKSVQESIKNSENELFSLKINIQEKLNPLKRPLKKAAHLGNKDLVSSLFKTFMSDSGSAQLNESLEKIKYLVKENRLSLKDKEKQKLFSIDPNELNQLKSSYHSIEKSINDNKKSLESFTIKSDKTAAEDKVNLIQSSISELKKDVNSLVLSKESILKEVSAKKTNIQDMILNKVGDKLEIKGI